MIVKFEKKFLKDINSINDKRLKKTVEEIIINLENAKNLSAISNLKKLKGYKYSYRIKVGDFRMGFNFEDSIIILVRLLNRKDIYRYFP
mgnify:CR=1 FL=1